MAVTNVAGFVWVQQVDAADDSMSLMCPHGTPPPTLCFIAGSIKRNLDLLSM
jgi:Pre-mRNA cleavage complex II protein Clp1